MTYRNTGNDPVVHRTNMSPEEVKAMLVGGGQGEETEGLDWRSCGSGRLISDVPEEERRSEDVEAPKVIDLTPAFSGAALTRARRQGLGRCPTCGRKSECCCPNCRYCGIAGRLREERRGTR